MERVIVIEPKIMRAGDISIISILSLMPQISLSFIQCVDQSKHITNLIIFTINSICPFFLFPTFTICHDHFISIGLQIQKIVQLPMDPASALPRPLTQQEIDILEQELSLHAYSDIPNENQLIKVATSIQNQLNTSITAVDIAIYLRRRPQPTPKSHSSLPSQPASLPLFSYFKQFAESCKQEEPKEKKEYVCRSKRKIRPTDPTPKRQLQDMVEHCDSNTSDCHILFQRKSRKNNAQQTQGTLHERCQWVFHQYFYSFFDRSYLREEEPFSRIQQALRLNPQANSYSQAKNIRLALPKPRLFNSQFISSEIERLNDYRNQARSSPKQRGKGQWELSVGREVLALHPVCGHLHAGSILAFYKQNLYMVKFVRPQLGTQKILDINISLRQVAHPHRIVVESVNFQVMALVIKLLQYKADLISLLGRYNDLAQEVQREQNALDNRFYQQYGWIGSTVNILSLGIRHILSRFRLRGLDSTNQERIGRNFASVLLNPLNLMEKQLDKSSQNSDVNASQQIKRIISNYKQSKVDQYSRELFGKHWQSLRDIEWSIQQREQFQILMRCLVGILVSLRVQQKGFSIQQNKYLKQLMNHFDSQFPEHFNQIYQLLASITAKLNDNDDPK